MFFAHPYLFAARGVGVQSSNSSRLEDWESVNQTEIDIHPEFKYAMLNGSLSSGNLGEIQKENGWKVDEMNYCQWVWEVEWSFSSQLTPSVSVWEPQPFVKGHPPQVSRNLTPPSSPQQPHQRMKMPATPQLTEPNRHPPASNWTKPNGRAYSRESGLRKKEQRRRRSWIIRLIY